MSSTPRQTRRLALARLGAVGRQRTIPAVQQVTAADCGAACLAMVLAYHGKSCRLEQVRQQVGCGRDGSTALDIVQAARHYGMRARGLKVELEELEFLAPGTVLHWGFQHFVVFERMRRGRAVIVDPAFGRRIVAQEELGRAFTGVAIHLEPGESFERQSPGEGPLRRYLRQALGEPGLWSRILVTSVMIQLFALALPVMMGALVDRVVPLHDVELLWVLLTGVVMMAVFHFATSMVRAHMLLHVRMRLDTRMTFGFVDHLVDLPFNFFQQRTTGDLLMRLNSNATVREILTAGVLSTLLDGLLVGLYLTLLLVVHVQLGLLVLSLGLAQAGVYLVTRRRQRELMSKNLAVQAEVSSFEVEMLGGMEVLKSMGAEQRVVDSWGNRFIDTLNVGIERGRLDAWTSSLLGALGVISPVLVLGYGATLVLAGTLTLGAMLGLSALASGFLLPLSAMVNTGSQLELLGSYLERIEDVMLSEPEQRPAALQEAGKLHGDIALERVSFRYAPNAPLVVRDIDVRIEAGQFIAIVGASGSGKSTLAKLLIGLYPPTEGRVLYDGTSLDHFSLRSVRRQVGVVPQEPRLFGRSIRANIALAAPDLPMTRVTQAAEQAQIHDEITQMPMGYETPLVDNGASLSGGQRQRIALARALVTEPSVLLLDEATSALDAVTEHAVQRALATQRSTRIVIAHRLSTIIAADQILVMEAGRIVQRGTHEQLLRAGGAYRSLVDAQLRGQDRC